MVDESPLKRAIRRIEEALREPQQGLGPDVYPVRGYDVGVLFETIKRYGGRRDWEPSEENILRLPGPVRRLIVAQRTENADLMRKLIASEGERRKLERMVAELRQPRR